MSGDRRDLLQHRARVLLSGGVETTPMRIEPVKGRSRFQPLENRWRGAVLGSDVRHRREFGARELEIAVGELDREDRREHCGQGPRAATLKRAGLDRSLEPEPISQVGGQLVGKRADGVTVPTPFGTLASSKH